MREAQAKLAGAQNLDPWKTCLERVRGKIDYCDWLERVSTQTLLFLLEVPERKHLPTAVEAYG